jgi:hypothetical protein
MKHHSAQYFRQSLRFFGTSLAWTIRALAAVAVVGGLVGLSSAQTTPTWAQSYGFASYNSDGTASNDPYYGSGYDYATGIAKMPDGGFVVGAQLDLPEVKSGHTGGNAHAALIRYSANGAIVWQTLFRQSDEDAGANPPRLSACHIGQIQTDAQGNIYVFGAKGGGGAYPFVAKFASSGHMIWQNGISAAVYRVVDSSGTHFVDTGVSFNGMGVTADGGVIVGGGEYEPGNGHSIPAVVKFNSDGSLGFHAAFEVGTQYCSAFSACQSQDRQHYAVLVQYPVSTSFPAPIGSTILLLDLNGNIVSQRQFDPEDGRIETPVDIFATPDNGFVAWSRQGQYQDSNVLVRKLSPTLVEQWERFVGKSDSIFRGHSLVETRDGGYLLAGQTGGGYGSNALDAALVKIGATGALQFGSVLGGLDNEGQSGLSGQIIGGTYGIALDDGGYAFTTETFSYKSDETKPDIWVARTNSNRRIEGFDDVMIDPSGFVSEGTNHPGISGSAFSRISPDVVHAETTRLPTFYFENLAAKTGINKPNIMIQAAVVNRTTLPPTGLLAILAPATPQNGQSWQFATTQSSTATGVIVKVQWTTTPALESSWTDLAGGGHMTRGAQNRWTLSTFRLPEGEQIYFRAVSSAPNINETVSPFSAPYNIATNRPPDVSLSVSAERITTNQSVTLTATASDTGGITDVAFYMDGALLSHDSTPPYEVVLSGLPAGDHYFAALATDINGANGLAGSNALHVVPLNGVDYSSIQGGAWNDPANWYPHAIPGPHDFAYVSQSMTLPAGGVEVAALTVIGSDGAVTGPGTVKVNSTFSFVGGTVTNATIELLAGATLYAPQSFPAPTLTSATLNNHGTVNCSGSALNGDSATVINNFGLFTFSLQFNSFSNEHLTYATFGSFNNHGLLALNGAALTLTGNYQQASGELDLGSALTPAFTYGAQIKTAGLLQGTQINVDGGTVDGFGKLKGAVQNSGYLAPGHSAGVVQIDGDYTQTAQGTLILELGGPDAAGPDYDQLIVSGTAAFNGKLDVRTINGFNPSPETAFDAVTFASHTGSFSSVSSNAHLTVNTTGFGVAVDPNAAAPPTGQPLNISTRMRVEGGDNVLIAGFIVLGPQGSTKKVMIRGLGPSLGQQGVPGSLPDPLLELHQPGGAITVNDDWKSGDTSQIPPGFAPASEKESVIVTTLSPGNYSAVLKGAHGESGVGLVELYDLDQASAAKLANISTRGIVKTGDDVMIGGFIIGGTEPSKVLIRAIGPSLPVAGALADPVLELHDTNGATITDDGWRAFQEQAVIASTIPPANDQEAAIVAMLTPGRYTAIVRGKNNTTGIALVEAYNLQ